MEENPTKAAPTQQKPKEIDYSKANISERYEDVYQIFQPNEVAEATWRDGAYQFNCKNGVALRVQVVAGGIIRLRYSPDGAFARDFSYALDPDFRPEKIVATLDENEDEYLLVSEKLQVVVQKRDLSVKFYDHDDRTLCEDLHGFSARRTILKGWSELKISKVCHRREAFFGMGDKACPTNLRGRTFEHWCSDAYGFGRDTDAMYRALPFYIALNQGVAYGIFFDNSFRSRFDFDSADAGETTFWAEGGEANYYFLAGPSLLDVARNFARLVGRHALPPVWALGYHQCRWSYFPDGRVLEIAQQFRDLQIPCDSIYLDIDYMDGFRVFTIDEKHFPQPAEMISDLKKLGFQTVVMIDPGVKDDPKYFVCREGLDKNHFLKTADGDLVKAPVWPGFCLFPDFTKAETREWWGDLYENFYQNLEIAGFWNDMNEPAVFHVHHKTLPDHVQHDCDGSPASHRKAHNIYGMQMNRASWEGLRRLQPERRPFLLSRATFAGGQRFAAIWTGDNSTSWEDLQIANVQCQRLSVCGFSMVGTDIGGFCGLPEPELYLRWLQLSVFHPLMRTHSKGIHESGDSAISDALELAAATLPMTDREPWSFGEKWTPLNKKAIELRYALLPTIYTAVWKSTADGTPALRHLVFEDANDAKLAEIERDFMFGDHLLVSPVVHPKVSRQMVYLPKGNWYYFWNGQLCAGDAAVTVLPEQIPFFVREGAVLPIYPIRQWTSERPVDELTLYVYYKNGLEISELYEDAGEGYEFLEGNFSLKKFETSGDAASFSLRQTGSGDWRPSYPTVKILMIGLPFFAKTCAVDGAEIPIREIRLRERSIYTLSLSPDFSEISWLG